MKTKFLVFAVLSLLFILACQTEGDDVLLEQSLNKEIPTKEPLYIDLGNLSKPIYMKKESGKEMEVFLYMAEYITSGDDDETGNIIFFNNRGNKQLGADFPVDPWYLDLIDGTNDISYYVDNNRPSNDMHVSVSNAAIDRAMTSWDEVTCSGGLGIIERPYDATLITGLVAGQLGFGGPTDPLLGWVADVLHAGWLPVEFFDAFSGGRGANILGVTFTWITGLDEDNDGKPDVWLREIYYNDAFLWTDGGTVWPEYDVETVALHEAGHGLSQGHFGKAFATGDKPSDPKWKVHFAPRAVMNASYSGLQTSIGKTDKAGHCSNWAQWPNN